MGESHYLVIRIWASYLFLNTPLVYDYLPEGQQDSLYFTGPMPLGSYL